MKTILEQNDLVNLSNPTFLESLGFSPNKGLLIIGSIGIGKTYALKKISKENRKGWGSLGQPTMYFRDSPVYEEDVTGQGISSLCNRLGQDFLRIFKDHDLYLDDLGSEKEIVNSFGNKFDPIQEILMIRYDGRNSHKTFMTTNLGEEEFKVRYGARVYSRIQEMCDIVIIRGGEDLRGRF